MGEQHSACVDHGPGRRASVLPANRYQERFLGDRWLRIQLHDTVHQSAAIAADGELDPQRAYRPQQDGLDEEPGVQEDAGAAAVGFFELSAGAEDGTV